MDSLTREVVLLDGGLATTLQEAGLPPYTPVEPWLTAHPERVLSAQKAFRAAGAQILLTATFRSLPSERDDWASCADTAIDIARKASDGGAVWLSLGPGSGHAEVVRRCGSRVDGVVLETFVNPDEALATLRDVRAVYDGPVVVSLVPGADGQPLGGGDLATVAGVLVDAGATGVGVNCAPPDHCVAAVERIPEEILVWVKPNGPDLADAFARLASRVRWFGGCCGTTPQALADVRRS